MQRARLPFAPTAVRDDIETVAHDIYRTVRSGRTLGKREIQLYWDLGDDDYTEVLRAVAKRPGVRKRRGRVGGLEPQALRPQSKEREPEPTKPLFEEGWKRSTVDRLVELLSYAELEGLLGELSYTLRTVMEEEGTGLRRGSKRELAEALVLKHDIDLFSDKALRTAVAKATRSNIEVPASWHAGKSAAVEFVQQAGFPLELAGRPRPAANRDLEVLESRVVLKSLEPFQKEVRDQLLQMLRSAGGRGIVSLPTGAGKTRVAVESLAHWLRERFREAPDDRRERRSVVWLAHTEELCEQACACFKEVWQGLDDLPPATLVRLWGSYTRHDHHLSAAVNAFRDVSIVVSTPNRLLSIGRNAPELSEAIRAHVCVVVIDEAHRAAAPIYRQLTDSLISRGTLHLLGLTATPFRMEYRPDDPEGGTRELREIFVRLIEPGDDRYRLRRSLEEIGILARPTFRELATGHVLSISRDFDDGSISAVDMERVDQELGLKADKAKRRLTILQGLVEILARRDASVLYFGPSVLDAQCMAFLLRRRGFEAGVVSGQTRVATRRAVVEEFKSGRLRVLCNCDVLTTGFDAPRVTHVVVGRPTVSQVLYEQMIGRGLRGSRFGGTEECTIVNCVDRFRGPQPKLGYQTFQEIWYSTSTSLDSSDAPIPLSDQDRRLIRVVTWLTRLLAGGARLTAEIEAAARREGFESRELLEARDRLNLQVGRDRRCRVTWALPWDCHDNP